MSLETFTNVVSLYPDITLYLFANLLIFGSRPMRHVTRKSGDLSLVKE